MEEKEIKEILSSHKKWLNNDAGGVKANLRHANLQDADLQDANLRHADLDFSVFPLWCGSFGMKVDDRLVTQLLGHIARLDYSMCSKDLQKYIKKIPKKYVNTICERHSCVDKL